MTSTAIAARADSLGSRMESIEISGTSLVVSRIGLGTWAIGGWMWGGTDEAQSIRTIHEALDRGITLFDTAPVYGFGRSEEILGKALAQDGRRKRAVIATKVGLDWRDDKPFRNGSRKRIMKEADDSLGRLQTDVIDLYQVHWPDPGIPIAETAAAMADLHRAGKIRAIGVSNFKSRSDGRISRDSTSAHGAAALQSVRTRHRTGRHALLSRASPRDARLWLALPRAPFR
jgi:aryl-alcohol dehydrogenase-like predicted oxidoreductase